MNFDHIKYTWLAFKKGEQKMVRIVNSYDPDENEQEWYDFQKFATKHTYATSDNAPEGVELPGEMFGDVVWQWQGLDGIWRVLTCPTNEDGSPTKYVTDDFETRQFLPFIGKAEQPTDKTEHSETVDQLITKHACSQYLHEANEPQFDCEMVEFQKPDLLFLLNEYRDMVNKQKSVSQNIISQTAEAANKAFDNLELYEKHVEPFAKEVIQQNEKIEELEKELAKYRNVDPNLILEAKQARVNFSNAFVGDKGEDYWLPIPPNNRVKIEDLLLIYDAMLTELTKFSPLPQPPQTEKEDKG